MLPASSIAMRKPKATSTGRSIDLRIACMGSAEEFEAVADAEDARRAEAQGGEQDGALDERLPQRRQIEDEEEVADRAQHEGAEDRADSAAHATQQRRAADHHHGDRIERVDAAAGRARLAGIGDEGEE